MMPRISFTADELECVREACRRDPFLGEGEKYKTLDEKKWALVGKLGTSSGEEYARVKRKIDELDAESGKVKRTLRSKILSKLGDK